MDVKHFEDCEQLFLSVGRCYIIEAMLEFLQMDDVDQHPMKNTPLLQIVQLMMRRNPSFWPLLTNL